MILLIAFCASSCGRSNTLVPENWEISRGEIRNIEKLNDPAGFIFTSSEPTEFEVSQTAKFNPGEYFLMAKISIDLDRGDFYLKAGNKGIMISDKEVTCNRTLFTFHVKESGPIKFSYGASKGAVGVVKVESVGVFRIEYKIEGTVQENPRTKLIQKQLGISEIPNNQLDAWVDSMAYNVNRAFLESNTEKGHDLLVAYRSDVFADSSSRYLYKFMNNSQDRSAYCQKSSLSLDEIIRSFGIPTRQLHWQESCSGIHQFLEYWNEEDQAWKIIDPYYGIRYVDNDGDYIGFEKVEALVRSGDFSPSNIKRINIGKLYYSEEEIMAGWQVHDLAVHVNNW